QRGRRGGDVGGGDAEGVPALLHDESEGDGLGSRDGASVDLPSRREDGNKIRAGRGNDGYNIPSGHPGEENGHVKKVLIADDDESIRWALTKRAAGLGSSPDSQE